MKNDLGKLIMVAWMCITVYFMYYIYADLKYMVDLVHAYITMVMEHVRR